MGRTEFIEKLRRALSGALNSSQVAENVRYYQEYIDTEVRRGRTEEEVLAQLGDPRLLAKSIIEANKHAGAAYASDMEYDEEVAEDAQGWNADAGRFHDRSFMVPRWLLMLISTVIVIVIIGLVSSLLYVFAPVIIVVLIVVLVVKIFQSNAR